MVSAISSALSGFTAAAQRLNVSAQNIAGATTPGYTPQQLVQSSDGLGGVSTSVELVSQPTVPVYNPSSGAADAQGITQYPNVDPATQLVNANISSYTAQGNLSVIKVQNNLFKSLLNIVS